MVPMAKQMAWRFGPFARLAPVNRPKPELIAPAPVGDKMVGGGCKRLMDSSNGNVGKMWEDVFFIWNLNVKWMYQS